MTKSPVLSKELAIALNQQNKRPSSRSTNHKNAQNLLMIFSKSNNNGLTSRNDRNPMNTDLFGSASNSNSQVAHQHYGLHSKDMARSSYDRRTKTSSFENTYDRTSSCAHRPCCKGSTSYIARNQSNLNLSIKSRRSSNYGFNSTSK